MPRLIDAIQKAPPRGAFLFGRSDLVALFGWLGLVYAWTTANH
jgi:hypothetical protein